MVTHGSDKNRQLLLLELNEVNFEFLCAYAREGRLPTFERLLDAHGYALTTSEQEYDRIEPWIQWVTAHTGRTFEEHRVFRLGDIVNHDIPQIWERFEQQGLRVGALSPMNAKHRLRAPAFFVPDPWTSTGITAPAALRSLYGAISQIVNDNAQAKISARSLFHLLRGFVAYAAPARIAAYSRLAASAARKPWRKAMFLDLLLSDVFRREVARTRPDFATLFVNAAAHIQHHYLFCSAAYRGKARNPDWYVQPGVDPVFEVYSLYDTIVRDVLETFPEARVMLATGLHQVPHEAVTFYWRLRDHADFLRLLGVAFDSVDPRMSRDFLVRCRTRDEARKAQELLESATSEDGTRLFEVDNRGDDVFVMFVYPHDIRPEAGLLLGARRIEGLRRHVSFVALKNGQHDGTGYLIDTGGRMRPEDPPIPLASMPEVLAAALGELPRTA